MILRIAVITTVLSLAAANVNTDRSVFEDVAYRELAKNPTAFAEKRIRIRAIYSYMFEVSRLRPTRCCSERGPFIWVDFDEERADGLLRQIPKGMGTVLGTFIGRIETGSVYGPNGEQVRLVIDRIEKIEKKNALQKKKPTGFREIVLSDSSALLLLLFDDVSSGC